MQNDFTKHTKVVSGSHGRQSSAHLAVYVAVYFLRGPRWRATSQRAQAVMDPMDSNSEELTRLTSMRGHAPCMSRKKNAISRIVFSQSQG
eukprot:3196466-Pleurochrysis_carterae.AAC.1